MDGALSPEVGIAAGAPHPVPPQDDPLSLESLEAVLRYWEQTDGGGWDESIRLECIALLQAHPASLEGWRTRLQPFPSQILERYRRVVEQLEQKGLINAEEAQAEYAVMQTASPLQLLEYGRQFAAWLRHTTKC